MIELRLPILTWICFVACFVLIGYYLSLKKKMKKILCQICGSDNVMKVKKTEVFEYKNYKVEVPDYVSVECNNCDQGVAEPESIKRSEPLIRAMHEKADREELKNHD